MRSPIPIPMTPRTRVLPLSTRTTRRVNEPDGLEPRRRSPSSTAPYAPRPASPGCGPGARPQRGSPGPSRPPRHDGGSRRGPFETSPPFRPLVCRLAHLPPVSLATLPAHGPSAGNRWSGAPTFGAPGRSPARPRVAPVPRRRPHCPPPSRYGKRGQQVRRWAGAPGQTRRPPPRVVTSPSQDHYSPAP